MTAAAIRVIRFRLSHGILAGLAAGVAAGLFFGERAAVLEVFGDAYVRLLQMTVLPYLTLSLVGKLGGMQQEEAGRLGARVGAVLVVLWAVALLAAFCMPLMLPRVEAASFFSTTLLDDRAAFDLIGLYIPSNPFNALANNIVPAVVLFSALLGVALIGVPGKAAALTVIHSLDAAVARVAHFVVLLTPFGLFAIAAVAAGTLDVREAVQLQTYLVAYLSISLLLSLWVLPALVAAVTPVPYRALLAVSRDALLLAFATGSVLVVLPLLAENARQLLCDHAHAPADAAQLPDVIVPATYTFPTAGKLLSITFVIFAAWFTGTEMSPASYPALAAAGLLTMFGSVNVAVPFLLDMFRIPADTFQLYLATGVINARFGTLLSAVHTLSVAVIGACAVAGLLRFDVRRLIRFGIVTAVLAMALVAGTRVAVARFLSQPYDKDKVLAGMHALRDRGEARVFSTPPEPLPAVTGSILDRIRSRRMLRVGYLDDSLPYAFRNAAGELVGFDVEMATQLARDLGVGLELVPADRRLFSDGFDPAFGDLVMSGSAITAERALRVLYSSPYLDETFALVVRDHRRGEFEEWDRIRAAGAIRVGVPGAGYYLNKLRDELPAAQAVTFETPSQMFQPRDPPLDALALTAERGAAYTLLHPEYSVVVPKPGTLKVPLAYAIAARDQALAGVVNNWIDLKRKDGTIDALFAHWILGRDPSRRERRWSILDNVLRRK